MMVDRIPAEYEATVGVMSSRRGHATPAGDPQRAAEIIARVMERRHMPSHLLLGVNAVTMAEDYSHRQLAEATDWSAVSRSADFAEPYPVELPPDAAPS